MLRVLYLFGESSGGIANYIRGLTEGSNDHKFLVFHSEEEENHFERRFPEFFRINFQYKRSAIFILNDIWKFSRIVKKNKIDIVNGHALKFGVYMILLKLLLPGNIRFVYTDHGSPFLQTKFRLKRAFLFLIEFIVTIGSDMRICVRENEYTVWNGVSNKIALVPTRVALPNLRRNCKKVSTTNVIMVGSIYDLKNPNYFRDVAELFEHNDRVNFSWIGPEGPDASLNQCITRSKVVNYLGELEYHDVQSAMRKADILLLTSKVEVTPLVMFEAFSSETLVISYDWLGVDGFITHGENGYILTNVKSVSDVIDHYSRNKTHYNSIVKLAKNNARNKFSDLETFRNEYLKYLYG